jgi:hypothetical protein
VFASGKKRPRGVSSDYIFVTLVLRPGSFTHFREDFRRRARRRPRPRKHNADDIEIGYASQEGGVL